MRNWSIRFDIVTDILHWRIGPQWRQQFHVKERDDDDLGFEAGYRVVRRLFHDIIDGLDPSVLPKNHRLPKAEAAELLAAADPQLIADRDARLFFVANSILETSVTDFRPLLDGPGWDGSVSVDGTPIATWAKGVRSAADYLATDPDAGWHVREGDHRDPEGAIEPVAAAATKTSNGKAIASKKGANKQKRRSKKYVFGYDATLVVARNTTPDSGPHRLPALVIAISLDRPGVSRSGPWATGRSTTTASTSSASTRRSTAQSKSKGPGTPRRCRRR
jgi:hypothetical protein